MVGMDNKVINQQQALWLTPDKARMIMIDIILKVQEEKRVKKQKNDAKELAASEKRMAAELATQVQDDSLQGRMETTNIGVGCNNECGAIKMSVIPGTVIPYDGRLGLGLGETLRSVHLHAIYQLEHKYPFWDVRAQPVV